MPRTAPTANAHTFAVGDRFTYTGKTDEDGVMNAIDIGATGVVTHTEGIFLQVTFDSVKDGPRDGWFVRPANVTKLVEPVAWKIGDRFTYTGDPALDWLDDVIRKGATGVITTIYHPRNFRVRFDADGLVRQGIHDEWSARASQITKLETMPETVWQFPVAMAAERDAAVAELAALKATVVRVAREKAALHGWCETVDSALVDMGLLETVQTTVRATIVVEVPVTHYAHEEVTEGAVHEALDADSIPGFQYIDAIVSGA